MYIVSLLLYEKSREPFLLLATLKMDVISHRARERDVVLAVCHQRRRHHHNHRPAIAESLVSPNPVAAARESFFSPRVEHLLSHKYVMAL